MRLDSLFQSFAPFHNPIGFGASDFVEFGLAAFFVALAAVWRPWLQPSGQWFARKTVWCFVLLVALPVLLRLALLPHHPVPTPDIYDEFSHLLQADTLRHFRLSNPTHPFHRFFETFFVLQEPTYSSIYPIGQGLCLAIGWTLFGCPWAGVLLAAGVFCGLCYWMLRGWISPGWALLGGLLAVMEFGPLNQWTNSYWGGAVPASAGCLVFGALPRLREHGRIRDAILLGLGLGIHALTRQFESIFLGLSVILFFLPELRRWNGIRPLVRLAGIGALALLPALLVTLAQNKEVTGSWTTLPEMLSQYQYGVPAALTFQADPTPHRELTLQQALGYKMQLAFRANSAETPGSYFLRLEYRVRYYRFFFLVPLYLALLVFLVRIRQYRMLWVALTAVLFALGVNFFPAFQFHYIAAISCLFLLMSVSGLEQLSRSAYGAFAARLLVFLCAAHFCFWYGAHLFDDSGISRTMRQYETWNTINHDNPSRRISVREQLARLPGRQLVFVRYSPRHIFQDEWVYNAADIDAARVVWARDRGDEENAALCRYYPKRAVWLLETDFPRPVLAPYNPAPPPVVAAPAPAPGTRSAPPPFKPGVNPFLPIPKAR
jgi:hypothetical protein